MIPQTLSGRQELLETPRRCFHSEGRKRLHFEMANSCRASIFSNMGSRQAFVFFLKHRSGLGYPRHVQLFLVRWLKLFAERHPLSGIELFIHQQPASGLSGLQ
jgi:hypothetical protein